VPNDAITKANRTVSKSVAVLFVLITKLELLQICIVLLIYVLCDILTFSYVLIG